MPNCFGALDGKLVKIKKPSKSGTEYRDYKGNFSINLMCLCDHRYRISWADIGEYGRKIDGNIFGSSSLRDLLDSGQLELPDGQELPGTNVVTPLFLVADAAFPLRPDLMKPFSGPNLSHEIRIYNYRISRARRLIENVFGILCAKWRILLRPFETNVNTTISIVKAICVLHNFLIDEAGESGPAALADKERDDGTVEDGTWRDLLNGAGLDNVQQLAAHAQNWQTDAKEIRKILIDYFNSPEGAVAWQESMI